MQVNEQLHSYSLGIRKMADMAREMPNAIRADVGESNLRAPQSFIDAMHSETDNLQFQYSDTLGVKPLREAIRSFEAEKVSHYEQPEVLVTCGGEAALYAIIASFVGPGDEYLIPAACFSPYSLIGACIGATPVPVNYEDESALRAALSDKTKLILVNTPNNPSGQVLSSTAIRHIAAVAQERDLAIISDDVYDRILFNGVTPPPHLASLAPERTFVLHSVSKLFSLSGVRVGWIIGEQHWIDDLKKMHRAMTSGTNTTAQYACVPLFQEHDYIEATRRTYEERATALWQVFDELGWQCDKPQGAMYLMPDVGTNGEEKAMSLLQEHGISSVPGKFFGPHLENRIRFSLGRLDLDSIAEIKKRLTA